MRKLIPLLLVLFCATSSTSILAQTHPGQSNHHPLQMMIKFTGTSISDIENYRDSIGATEIWISPITETRLWELDNFDGINDYYLPTVPINDVIGAIVVQETRDDIDSGLNFQTRIDPGSSGNGGNGGNGTVGSPGGESAELPTVPSYAALCHQDVNKAKDGSSNLSIAILDTGISESATGIDPTFQHNYFTGTNDAIDLHGHGSTSAKLVEQTFEANTNVSFSEVDLLVLKTHQDDGFGPLATVLLAMEEAAEAGADVINMSFSYNCSNEYINQLFQESIDTLMDMNILINASAGNGIAGLGIDNDNIADDLKAYPATYDNYNIISVGAYNCFSNDISDFSNFGLYSVDILAPGNGITSFNFSLGQYTGGNIPGSGGSGGNGGTSQSGATVTTSSGCSQATAITSGLALALGTYQSAWDYEEVKCAILKGRTWKNLSENILTSGMIDGQNASWHLQTGCDDIITTPLPPGRSREDNPQYTFVEDQKVNIYPNPAMEDLFVDISNFSEPVDILIFNSTGQLLKSVKQQTTKEVRLDVSDLSKGFYMVKCETEKVSLSQSIIIE